MTIIKFKKMHGLGNDFMVIDSLRQKINLTPELIRQWSDRKTGVGFDQLLLLSKANKPDADFHYQIYNADGTQVEQCGNGARCIAKYLFDEKLTTKTHITVHCLAGLLNLELKKDGQVSVNMGAPIFDRADIPVHEAQSNTPLPLQFSSNNTGTLEFENQRFHFVTLSMGNPHCVFLVDSLNTAPVAALGQLLNQHPQFPAGVNVGFMHILDPTHIELRVYERGAGETKACGSGACAAVVAGGLLEKLNHCVKVHLLGGDLTIESAGPLAEVIMTGPASYVFQGEITL